MTVTDNYNCMAGKNNVQPTNGASSLIQTQTPSQSLEASKPEAASTAAAVGQCQVTELPKIQDPRGNLTFLESERHLPFVIRRVFYLYDVPGGADRAGHALKTCHQFLIALSGSFDVVVYDGKNKRRFHLNRPYYGLHLPPRLWREMDNFSSGSVCLVLASEPYDEQGYFRSYREYLRALGEVNS